MFNAVLGLVQESRAQATLNALKLRLALIASVQRDEAWSIVPAADLVPGDVVKLSLGGVVAAHVQLDSGNALLDHSMLTGESVPVEAAAGAQDPVDTAIRTAARVTAEPDAPNWSSSPRSIQIALSDPPRDDSAQLIMELRDVGVRAVMVTGDAPASDGCR